MSDWILGLKKAADTWMPGVGEEDIRQVEAWASQPFPEELRALYRQLDGGTFSTEVALFPLRGRAGGRGVLERSGESVEGLPARGVWRFGGFGTGGHLFAARKGALAQVAGTALPDWFGGFPEEGWVFGLKSEDTGELSLYQGLDQLLWELIPPAETEEFGENTFIQALHAVGSTLEALGEGGTEDASGIEQQERPAKTVKPRARRKKAAKAPAKKAAKAPAKKAVKAPTKKAVKAPAKKAVKAPAKKPAARKSSGRTGIAASPKVPGKARPALKPSRRPGR